MTDSFYWHDYETWGARPSSDRPCQFAGMRTDADLNPVGEPLTLFCRPADDLLPLPEACLVTGITPQRAEAEGIPEAEFARRIQRELAIPGTCSVGYNSLRFDDEVTRHLFYRNLLDPYAHAFRNGNSRWDLIDALRLAHALRPEGIHWPEREPGITSFRLEHLTAANGIGHAHAHDALSDVRATIALARLLKGAQPRLFDHALRLRDSAKVCALLERGQPLLHVSQRYSAAQGCIAPVLVVAEHPRNSKEQLCFDLRHDPSILLDLTPEAIAERLFTAADDLPEGVERISVKGFKINACPMLAPMGTLTDAAAERWDIDRAQVQQHAGRLLAAREQMADNLRQAYGLRQFVEPTDPEQMLYSGGFFSAADRQRMERLRVLPPSDLADSLPRFDDRRLPTLLFRMRARSWPETLSAGEREDWDAWRFERLTDPDAGASITIDGFEQRIAELRNDLAGEPARLALLDALEEWAERVMDAAT
ncbi:exodeoxyribonuclease I [Thiohalocapsa marina]|uniref:Exodeoxyribonuclease I n=1 Tax=Thiohalocapsa marina TaxID=424902 RepID=A0A5M8FNT7_9GAMM|nr:exodeoxyribonuclease I [Thiohalocapsa marina]KAA6185660.1 exodeoxyribonuclease I [Thiohalocapsa marina]